MSTRRRPPATPSDTTATCPECGASVPLVGERWLQVHREGSSEYVYPRGSRIGRCPGSLLSAAPPRQASDGVDGVPRQPT